MFSFTFDKRVVLSDYTTIPFCHLFMMSIIGPSQSGKTYWIYKLITPVPKKVVYLHGTYQPFF